MLLLLLPLARSVWRVLLFDIPAVCCLGGVRCPRSTGMEVSTHAGSVGTEEGGGYQGVETNTDRIPIVGSREG